MTKFTTAAEAVAAGFTVTHDVATQRFVLHAGTREIGEAHYRMLTDGAVNFDHTVVHPQFRGTGLSGVLAQYALTSEIAQNHIVRADCWFIAQYLREHPELTSTNTP